MNTDLSNFKHILEYFVAHLNYVEQDSTSITGYKEYIEPYMAKQMFNKTGQGYNGDRIQNQISQWQQVNNHLICINIRPNYKTFKSRKCYLNWKDTGINIYCTWNANNVSSLYIGYYYWWSAEFSKPLYRHIDIQELNLYGTGNDDSKLEEFYNAFCSAINDYENKRGEYYTAEQKYINQEKMRKYTELLKSNLILTGAPGTGKTYLAKQIAAQIILGKDYNEKTASVEEKNKMNEQYGFVQFHPSYDYTDFVEGLRPMQDESGHVGFERKDGVFKIFCKKAIKSSIIDGTDNFEEGWKQLVDYLNENLYVDIPLLTGTRNIRVELNEYGTGLAERLYEDGKSVGDEWIRGHSKFFTREQLYNIYRGNPGTPSGGHDNYRRAIVKYMIDKKWMDEYKPGHENNESSKYVFVIDEINRGDMSKIFGELFFSIDPGYRGTKGRVETQYQNLIEDDDDFKDGFYVPENVYIIGTMNDIDRSVESMDFAMRRRFTFVEVRAEDRVDMIKGTPELQQHFNLIAERMNNLNLAILTIKNLSSAYQIGAAYYLKLKNYLKDDGSIDDDSWKKLWDNHLHGLLFEYLRGLPNAEEDLKTLQRAYNLEDRYEMKDGKPQKIG